MLVCNMGRGLPIKLMLKMKNKHILKVILIFILALSLRLLYLEKGFFGDEAITLASASLDFEQIIPNLISTDAHPPLTAILLHFWMEVGHTEIFIRLYFILFGLAVLLVIYLMALELFSGNKKLALLALFLGAISPLLISLSQFVRNYIDSAFWILLSNYFLLRIIRGKAGRWTWTGYVIAGVLSIYSFYFSAIIILSQSILVFTFKSKNTRILKRWITSQFVIALLFSPWLFNMFAQVTNNRSARFLHWEAYGFKIAGLNLGIYARNIASLFGFDYFFIYYPEGIVKHFGIPFLFVVVSAAFVLLGIFLYSALKWLSSEFRNDLSSVWFLPFLSLLPLLISWCGVKISGSLPNARYLAAPHAMFIILIAYFLYKMAAKYRKAGFIILSLFILSYILRIPAAVTPAYEGKKALSFLKSNLQPGDCILMLDRLPGAETLPAPVIDAEKGVVEIDPLTSAYRKADNADTLGLRRSLSGFKRVWFVRFYGNTELFGGNQLAYEFLESCNRKEKLITSYNNIRIILME